MQQRSTEQRSTVGSTRRLTDIKMLVHQCQQSWDSPSNYDSWLIWLLCLINTLTFLLTYLHT